MLPNVDKKVHGANSRALDIISLDIKIQNPTWAADDFSRPHRCLGEGVKELRKHLSNLGNRSRTYPRLVIIACICQEQKKYLLKSQ